MSDSFKEFTGIRSQNYPDWKDFVTKRMMGDSENVVWRGQASDHDNLLPSIYRTENYRFGERPLKTLRMFYEQCQGLAADSANLPPIDFKGDDSFNEHEFFTKPECLQWWSLAQHHGLPTPFLDWSYYPLIALFFAMTDFSRLDSPQKESVDVWELSQATRGDEYSESVLQRFVKTGESKGEVDGEICFFSTYGFQNRRIVAQGGLFTYVKPPITSSEGGDSCSSSESDIRYLFDSIPEGAQVVREFSLTRHIIQVVKKDDVGACRRFLAQAGITQRTLFPDIRGVIDDCCYRIAEDDYTCCQVPLTQRDLYNREIDQLNALEAELHNKGK